MPKQIADVTSYLANLKHPFLEGIASLRAAILASNPAITEHIKWNAPSFCHGGDDRVTLRLPPKGGLQLIFHRGAKVRSTEGFVFEDTSGLIAWAAVDRGVVTIASVTELQAKMASLVDLVNAWMRATADSAHECA